MNYKRVNIGCGQTPTPGWQNYDNSWSIRLAQSPLLNAIARRLSFLNSEQKKFIDFAASTGIQWADATKRIPEPNASVEVLYSSHMLEHLDKEAVTQFLSEARRILISRGIIRIAVPDIRYHVQNYLQDKNADLFIANTGLTRKRPRTLRQKFHYLIVGDRNHQWMYDGGSLCRLLTIAGFNEAQVMNAGNTIIHDPQSLNLEERAPESVFVEGINP